MAESITVIGVDYAVEMYYRLFCGLLAEVADITT
jgi:hypothetical protein